MTKMNIFRTVEIKCSLVTIKKYLLFLLLFSLCSSEASQSEISEEITNADEAVELVQSPTTTSIPSTTSVSESNLEENKLEPPKYLSQKNNFVQFDNCKDFKGIEIKTICGQQAEILESFKFENEVVDVIEFKDVYYIVLKRGEVYQLDIETGDKSKIIDYSDKVSILGEGGMLSIAFSNLTEDFLLSYVDKSGNLTFELNKYSTNPTDIISKEVLLSLKNASRVHFAGNVIWSEYFNDYIVGVGDFKGNSDSPRLNTDPQNLSTPLGKIMLLRSTVRYSEDLPTVSGEESEQLSNILALGLRNPWKFFEVNDSLYIFDVGLYDFEELNVLKYESLPGNFGWPYFEGIKRSKDISGDMEYRLDMNTFSSDKYVSFEEYIEHEALLPTVFYDHKASESTSRFAIIGGDLIFDNNSDFNLSIVFSDFLSNELFLFDLINNKLTIMPVNSIEGATSVKHFEKNKILLTTTSGFLHIIELKN